MTMKKTAATTTTTTTLTQHELFTALLELDAVKERPELVKGLHDRLSALESAQKRKADKPRKSDPAVEGRKADVLALLADGVARPCKDVATLTGMSVGQASGALTALKKVGKVKREEVKGVAFFSLPAPSEE